jgi:hypothetical protein
MRNRAPCSMNGLLGLAPIIFAANHLTISKPLFHRLCSILLDRNLFKCYTL